MKKKFSLLLVCCIAFCMCSPQQTKEEQVEEQTKVPAAEAIKRSEDAQVIKTIKDFYLSYTDDHLSRSSIDSLIEKHLTKALIAKVRRVSRCSGADAILRAQDYSDESRKTYSVKHLDGNWYMFSYFFVYNEDTTHIHIPLRIAKTNNQYRIDYITPYWNESMYGDHLLINNPTPKPVDASDPLSLLNTFYAAYTQEYCSMPEDLDKRLQKLREEYCTKNALEQFEKAAKYSEEWDGMPGYDLLIANFDFDNLWIPSITFTHRNGEEYTLSYKKEEAETTTIRLHVTKEGEAYRISSIYLK